MDKIEPNVYFVFGVSGCGKTTIGSKLANELDIPFYDADDFHPKANIDKMSSGQPLNDLDRQPWLETVNTAAKKSLDNKGCVFACSALKQEYRRTLSQDISESTVWIYLQGTYEVILDRMQSRNHFMPPSLLQSQFDTLEEPKEAICIDINDTIEDIIHTILNQLAER